MSQVEKVKSGQSYQGSLSQREQETEQERNSREGGVGGPPRTNSVQEVSAPHRA
jgi:hypothetical protein